MSPEQVRAILVIADRSEETIRDLGDRLVRTLDEIHALKRLVALQEGADKDLNNFMADHVSRETSTAAMPSA